MKSGRYELQIERERCKGEIHYTAFSNHEAANELIAIQRLWRANATLHNEHRVERKQRTKENTKSQKAYEEEQNKLDKRKYVRLEE
jgi:hypothetical protein